MSQSQGHLRPEESGSVKSPEEHGVARLWNELLILQSKHNLLEPVADETM